MMDPTDSMPVPKYVDLDRTYYDRNDAVNAIGHHLAMMLYHLRHAERIDTDFQLGLPLPPQRPLLEMPVRCAMLKRPAGARPLTHPADGEPPQP